VTDRDAVNDRAAVNELAPDDGSMRPSSGAGSAVLRLCDPDDPVLAPATALGVARAHVEAALPGAPDHEAARRRILDFVATHPDALHRSCAAGHLTGSAMVVDPGSQRFLLMLHAKVGLWLQPGGHADGDAALPGVALKEATEETGVPGLRVAAPAIDLDVHEFVAPREPRHLHLDVRYLVLAPPGAEPVRNHESRGLGWFSLAELTALGCDHGTIRMAHAALAALPTLDPRS
jgi:8-oxo-dGTP pyrophosphatase MutT (NUDIX family)